MLCRAGKVCQSLGVRRWFFPGFSTIYNFLFTICPEYARTVLNVSLSICALTYVCIYSTWPNNGHRALLSKMRSQVRISAGYP